MKKMNRTEDEIKADIFKLLIDNGFGKAPFSIKQEDLWRIDNAYHRLDICIYKYDQILAIFEIVQNVQALNTTETSIRQWLEKTDATYGIITNGQSFLLFIKSSKSKGFKIKDFETLSKILKRKKRLSKFQEKIQKCAEIIKRFKLDYDFEDYISLKNENQISFTENSESTFFNLILSLDKDTKTIYRYTSLKTLFSILETRKYRMCGLAGMNDKTEKDYFDNYIGKSSEAEIENNIFISSCSLLRDDLTMWRLYGDDGKGVCLAFEIQNEISPDLNLLKIDYGHKLKKHEKIDFLKELLDSNFFIKDLNKWKHFFKGYEYKEEREERLLFCNNNSIERKWVITYDNNIINPVDDFPLNECFPLKLKSVRLGPKFPESVLNKYQMKEILKDKNFGNVQVYRSKITSYR